MKHSSEYTINTPITNTADVDTTSSFLRNSMITKRYHRYYEASGAPLHTIKGLLSNMNRRWPYITDLAPDIRALWAFDVLTIGTNHLSHEVTVSLSTSDLLLIVLDQTLSKIIFRVFKVTKSIPRVGARKLAPSACYLIRKTKWHKSMRPWVQLGMPKWYHGN